MNKIKKALHKAKEAVGSFFQKIFAPVKRWWHKVSQTKFMQKVINVLAFIPRKIKGLKNHTRKVIWGLIFLVPLMIGFIYFFLIPFIYTIWFSLSYVYIRAGEGLKSEFIGIDNFKYLFNVLNITYNYESIPFTQYLVQVIILIATDIPIILIFSLIMAVVLNSKFKGRALVRAIFFMPVIFNSQAIDMAVAAIPELAESTSNATADLFNQMFSFKEFLTNANFPTWLVNFLSSASSRIYDVITYSGIQILIFLSAIQSVPRHLYEAAKMEGATQYEMFWKITFPMVSPMLLAAAVYTVVDSFLRSPMVKTLQTYDNPGKIIEGIGELGKVVDGVHQLSFYGAGAAISIVFFAIAAVIVLVVLGILSRVVFYYDE